MLTVAEADLLKLAVQEVIQASCVYVTAPPDEVGVAKAELDEKRSVFRVLLENITEKS